MRTKLLHLPLARPWTWALTDAGLRCLFFTQRDERSGRQRALRPAPEVLASWVAVHAGGEYDGAAPDWIDRATGLHAPGDEDVPGQAYVAVARVARVGTIANDPSCYDKRWSGWDPWWNGAVPCRGIIAWWLEDVLPIEPLPWPLPPGHHQPRAVAGMHAHLDDVDADVLPELRERARLARTGVWKHTPWKPAAKPHEPSRRVLRAEDVPWPDLPPMTGHVQLDVFSDAPGPAGAGRK